MIVERRRRARLQPGRRRRRDQPHPAAPVGGDDPADRPARPARPWHSGPSTSRPRRSSPALRRRCGSRRCGRSRARRCGSRRPRRAGRRLQADARRVAEQRQLVACSGTVGQPIGGSCSAAAYRASRPSFHCARCSCQMPSPIISATAARTTIVGMIGKRRIIRRSFPRARDADIPGRAAHALPSRSPPMVSAAATGTQTRCTHHGGSSAGRARSRRPRRSRRRSGSGRPPARRRH